MSRTRIKICGITRPVDAMNAVDAGADALGFMFYDKSRRYIEPERAAAIAIDLPAFVTRVAVVVDPTRAELESLLSVFPADLIQFHGNESPDLCEVPGRPFIKAIPATCRDEIVTRADQYRQASGIMLDTAKGDGQFGGTGEAFDWAVVPALSKPVVMAGGLHAGNVREVIQGVAPFAVDVSTGVEGSAGQKDPEKILAFAEAVRQADQEKT